MNKTLIFVAALAMLLLAACSDDRKQSAGSEAEEANYIQTINTEHLKDPNAPSLPEGDTVVVPTFSSGIEKEPEEYRMEDFLALSEAEKEAFSNYLNASGIGFEQWYAAAKAEAEKMPWNEAGAKLPDSYTIEEYRKLSDTQKEAFSQYLNEVGTGFDQWYAAAVEAETACPWDEVGAKQPNEYTMEEFEALTEAQKELFSLWLNENGYSFQSWFQDAEHE